MEEAAKEAAESQPLAQGPQDPALFPLGELSIEGLKGGRELLRRIERIEAMLSGPPPLNLSASAGAQDVLPNQVAIVPSTPPAASPFLLLTQSSKSQGKHDLEAIEVAAPKAIMDVADEKVNRKLRAMRCADEFGPFTVDFPESVYSDVILTCARGRIWPIVSSSLVLFVCLAVQILFTMMVAVIAVDTISGTTNKDGTNMYAEWRKEMASSSENDETAYDELSYICAGDSIWMWEASVVGDMSDYASMSPISGNSVSSGVLFGCLSISLWIGYFWKEIRNIGSFMCLLSLPRPAPGALSFVFNEEDQSSRLIAAPVAVRIAVIVVSLARFCMTVALNFYGVKFLAYTTTLGDFILNCVALLFIQDVDDLCFSLFLSRDKQRAVRTLIPPAIEGKASKVLCYLSPFTELLTFLAVVISSIASWGYLLSFADSYMCNAYNQVCLGQAQDCTAAR